MGAWLLAGGAYGAVNLSLESLRHPLFFIQGLQFDLDEQQAVLAISRLQAFGQDWRGLKLSCGQLSMTTGHFRCEQGHLYLPGSPNLILPLFIRQQGEVWTLDILPGGDERWQFSYGPRGRLQLRIHQGQLQGFQAVFPSLKQMGVQGQVSGEVHYEDNRLDARLDFDQGVFSRSDGRQAGESLAIRGSFSASRRGPGWQVAGNLDWLGGAIYAEPLFLQAAAQTLAFAGYLDLPMGRLDTFSLAWPGMGRIEGQLAGRLDTGGQEASLSLRDLSLQALGQLFLKPLFEARGWPTIQLAGRADARMVWHQGRLSFLELVPEDAGLVLENGRFGLEGGNGRITWDASVASEGLLDFTKLNLGRLESGAFHLPLQISPRSVTLKGPVSIPFLDSEVVIDHLRASLPSGESPWEGRLGLSLYPVSLAELTRRLDIPVMGGKVAANLPGIHYRDGVANLEGTLIIQVFEGYLHCTNLSLIDPFGTMPRILAEVDARHLNLGQLTETFSFGQMDGFIDAQIHGLELAGWRPLAFDARVESSPGDYPRRISQRAVADITALGGGGAKAAIQSSFLRFFQDFGYRQIGLSCRLENGVCRMAGVEGKDRNGGYVLVEGGGIPALTVIGYNRRVQWDELVDRLRSAIKNSTRPVVK